MNLNTFTFVACITLIYANNTTSADVIFSQQPTSNTDNLGLGWFSHSEPRATRNFKHADNFQLDSPAQVDQINWWGISEGLVTPGLENFDSFQIEFWTSFTRPNGRFVPDSLITSETFSLDEINTIDTGRQAANGAIEFKHQIDLTDPLALDAGTTYWISISARSIDGSGDAWQWQDADPTDTISTSWSYADNRWLYFEDTDSAFELISVPTPASSLMLTTGLAIFSRRRRIIPNPE
jgi:hypothetical protein